MAYLKKLMEVSKALLKAGKMKPGKMTHAGIAHDNDCRIWTPTKQCSCEPDMIIEDHTEPYCAYCSQLGSGRN